MTDLNKESDTKDSDRKMRLFALRRGRVKASVRNDVHRTFLLVLSLALFPGVSGFAGSHFDTRIEKVTPMNYLVRGPNKIIVTEAHDHPSRHHAKRAWRTDVPRYAAQRELNDWQTPSFLMVKDEAIPSSERKIVVPEPAQIGQRELTSATQSHWQTLVPIPSDTTLDAGAPTPPPAELLRLLLGEPNTTAAGNACKVPDGPILSALIATRDVGPFTTQLIAPALDSLERVMDAVRKIHPDLYAEIGIAGGTCVRLVRGSDTVMSTHSWGTAIDITIGGEVTQVGSSNAQAGLVELAKEFAKEGWVWGAYLGRPNPMHFLVGAEQLQKWKKDGILDVVDANTSADRRDLLREPPASGEE